jgi:tyrosinase
MNTIIDRSVPSARQAVWRDAAQEWRLPYWDWAARQGYINNYGVPEIFTRERIDIIDFADNSPVTTVSTTNPLWKFSNPLGFEMGHRTMGIYRIRNLPVVYFFADDTP